MQWFYLRSHFQTNNKIDFDSWILNHLVHEYNLNEIVTHVFMWVNVCKSFLCEYLCGTKIELIRQEHTPLHIYDLGGIYTMLDYNIYIIICFVCEIKSRLVQHS